MEINWNKEILELEEFFAAATLPTISIQLNKSGKVNNAKKFVETHLMFIKENNGKEKYLGYLNHLQELKSYLSQNNASNE